MEIGRAEAVTRFDAENLEFMTTILLATRNAHKTEEIRAILGPGFHCLTLKDFPAAPPVVEDGLTFADNARKKAVELARWLFEQKVSRADIGGEFFVLADDSGLEVDALDGQPGVHSARFAAEELGIAGNSPDADNNAKLLRLLKNVPEGGRTARFRCVLALIRIPDDGSPLNKVPPVDTFDGQCEGRIAAQRSGEGGFGYDPLFVPVGYRQSFAELGEELKNEMSHRAQALKGLQRFFRNRH